MKRKDLIRQLEKDGCILLKPVTAAMIKRGRGIARRKPDDKPFDQWWAEHKAGEKALEEAKYACSTGDPEFKAIEGEVKIQWLE